MFPIWPRDCIRIPLEELGTLLGRWTNCQTTELTVRLIFGYCEMCSYKRRRGMTLSLPVLDNVTGPF